MPLIKAWRGESPQTTHPVYLAENATLIGRVHIGRESSLWYNAVARGDVEAIFIGEQSNIQDGAILHCSTGRSPLRIGSRVTVGHAAILHGCTLHDELLIGMGATVLDDAVVPSHTLVAAGALVPERMVLESGFLYAGIPAKKIRPLTEAEIAHIRRSALHYVEMAKQHFG